jgi:hypothetical protein
LNDTKRNLLSVIVVLLVGALVTWRIWTFLPQIKMMYVQVEDVLADNLAVVKGVDKTSTENSFLAEFRSTKDSMDQKTLKDFWGKKITIEYLQKEDNRVIVDRWYDAKYWQKR